MRKIIVILTMLGASFIGNAQNVDLKNGTDYIRTQKSGETGFSRSFGLNGSNELYIGSVEKTISNIYFYNKGSNHLMTIRPDGNVGIGTTAPDAKLQVHINGNERAFRIKNDLNNSQFNFWTTQVGSHKQLRIDEDTNGKNIATFFQNGNVGIGTTTPTSRLDVRTSNNKGVRLNFNNESAITFVPNNGNSVFHLSHGHDNRLHVSQGGTVGEGKLMTFVNNGNVGIGTTNPGSWKLAVNGNIRAKEIKVETGWSDFVFYDDYKLPTLEEVETHIQQKGHLKDIPSAKEVAKNGIFLGEMDSKLLQKIEELTLYTIAQEKQIEVQNNKIKMLEKRLEQVIQLIDK
ncbi:hypothetical protein ABW636_08410 [Aquimarina sp. 2201CG1-2-11]|uniref:hypothetical protein n=1 Tax=Aquimarina discodermiae TaxID=3231043 RepID=UPI003463073E